MLESNTSVFYAVRPELVLRAAKHFDVRASVLDGGARTLYNKAVAMNAGKASGRWGKHQRAVIKQFCEYTATSGSDALLPWQELVEDEMNYDGKEGISARTGNRPLSTVQRVGVNIGVLNQAKAAHSIDLPELAKRSGLPQRFLQAIEDGKWSDISTTTAEQISTALGLPTDALFIYPPGNKDDVKGDKVCATDLLQQQKTLIEKLKSNRLAFFASGFVLLLSLSALTWLLISQGQSTEPTLEDFTSSQWRMSVELINRNIPIPEETINLWQNGGYIQLREHGIVAFNWIDPSSLVELPHPAVSWEMDDNRMTLTLDDIIYSFTISEDHETLVTLDTTKSFEMTLQAISQ